MSLQFDVLIEFSGQSIRARGEYEPGSPGRTTGPPESCYPPEPAEIIAFDSMLSTMNGVEVELLDLPQMLLTDEFFDQVSDLVLNQIEAMTP